VYGASDEFHQRFVPGRTADVLDWLADSLGACAFVIVPWWKTRATHAAGTAD
jgi:VanZ family protein